MKRQMIIYITLLVYLILPQLEALNRDYSVIKNYTHQPSPYCAYSNCTYYIDKDNSFCLDHFPFNLPWGINGYLLNFIPATGPECIHCYHKSIYFGYLDSDFHKYLPHLKRHLEYSSHYSDCFCLWPEYSEWAAYISNTAYFLFRDLISTTALSQLIENENEQKELVKNSSLLNVDTLTISFIAQQFRFSDYYHVCRDIENYAKAKYEEKEAIKIKDKLDDMLEILYKNFLILYTHCYKWHHSLDIDQEIRFMKLLVNDSSGLEEAVISKENQIDKSIDSHELCLNATASSKDHSSKSFNSEFSPQSEIFLEQGSLYNSLLLHKEAIQVLTQAIQLNACNRDAYIERAMAYFETNQLSLALKDYESAKRLTIAPPFKPGNHEAKVMLAAVYVPGNKTEFANGLILGTVDGAKVSVIEFFPSIFSSLRGILNGLWAFVCTPIDVSQEMINSAYAIGEYISTHAWVITK